MIPHLEKEVALHQQGYCFVGGMDEAGRGAWAGPVVAAAVILPLEQPNLPKKLAGLQDSKQMTARKRDYLFDIIQDVALAVTVGIAPASIVDTHNVVGATRYAMEQALNALNTPAGNLTPDHLLLDHITLPAVAIPQTSFPKADATSLTVASASVIAKVTRDRMMVAYHQQYPHYAFDRHKGYGTRVHRQALAQHGACPLHRMTFAPLQRLAQQTFLDRSD